VVSGVGTTGREAAGSACQSGVRTVETALEVSKAETKNYVAPLTSLVSGGYLRELPTNSHFSLDVDSSGDVLVTPAGGSTIAVTPGGSTTPAVACGDVK
jgi:hypothetical protein